MRIFWFWLLLIIPCFTNAQETHTVREIIHLKDGSVLFGEIMEWKQGEYLKLRLRNDIDLTIPAETIAKVVMKKPRAKFERIVTPGMYGGGAIGFGFAVDEGLMMADAVLGYRFKPMVQLGLGLGAYQFEFEERVRIFPLFAEWRSEYSRKRIGPYTLLRVGTGFGTWSSDFGFGERSYNPGLLLSPIVGLRLGQIGAGALAIEAGYLRYQGAYKELGWSGNVNREVSYSYQRWLFRLAIGF